MPITVGVSVDVVPKKRPGRGVTLVDLARTATAVPRPEVARGWRQSLPPDLRVSIRAHRAVTHGVEPGPAAARVLPPDMARKVAASSGPFDAGETAAWAWARTAALAEAIDAAAVLFSSPSFFGPSAANREVLARFFGSLERKGRRFVWIPPSLWEPEDISDTCSRLDLVEALDPILADREHRDPGGAPAAWLVLAYPPGLRAHYDEFDFERVARWGDAYGEATVLFCHAEAWTDAGRFAAFLAQRG
jgi:uncharacterized protein YecE (DUF72 family)